MKAIGYNAPCELNQKDALVDIIVDKPIAEGRDLLVKIHAVSVNPVDGKVRRGREPVGGAEYGILGYDAAGVVASVGSEVENFQVGDEVWYAGSIARQGTNSEYHLVDERIVGYKPNRLSMAESAALPLTAITSWEMLFDRLDIYNPPPQGGNTILVIGGAGGVGSITIQLLASLTNMTIIATASRPETQAWVKELGAHYVVNHREPLAPQVAELGVGDVGFVFSITQTHQHMADIVELIAPQGRFGLIDDPDELNIKPFKVKSISTHWELMFTRPIFNTPDMAQQGQLLNEVANLVDDGKIRSTMTEIAGKIDAETLLKAHAKIESGTAKGKIVLEGF